MSERPVGLSALSDGMAEFHADMAKAMGCPDWTYRDIPWVTAKVWDQFFDIVGAENCRIIAATKRGDGRRGQVLVSPAGMARCSAFAAAKDVEGERG